MSKVLMSMALMALIVLAASPAAGGDEVLLGINYPLTGPYSVEGLDEIRAAQMAVDEINAEGGILGLPVRLVRRDSASDVLLTRLNVNQLVDEGCDMIFGGSSSAVAIEAGRICQERGVPFFGTLTYSTATTLENAHRMSFRECSNSWMSARALSGWLNERFAGKNYFYITADYTWGWTTEASMREVTGTGDVDAHPRVLTPLGSTDYIDALTRALAARPDVLVLTLFGKDLAHALRQATDMGLKDGVQIVVPNLTLGMAERAGADAMQNVVGTLPWTWKVPAMFHYERGQRFVEAFVARYHRYPSTAGASAYTIVHEYKSAVERAGSLDPAEVVRALEGHYYQLLKGEQYWRALDHQSVQDMYVVRGNDPATVLADPLRLNFFTIVSSHRGEDLVRPADVWRRLRREAGLPDHLEPLPGE